MTDLGTILDRLRAAGITIRAEGGDLVLAGNTGDLAPDLRRQLVTHKTELLALLSEPPGAGCPRCGRRSPAPGASCDHCLDSELPRPLYLRYRVAVRWAKERGWLAVRDPFTGEWHEIAAREAPASWLEELRKGRGR